MRSPGYLFQPRKEPLYRCRDCDRSLRKIGRGMGEGERERGGFEFAAGVIASVIAKEENLVATEPTSDLWMPK